MTVINVNLWPSVHLKLKIHGLEESRSRRWNTEDRIGGL